VALSHEREHHQMVLELSGGVRGQFLSREGRGRMHCGCAGLESLQRLLNYYNSQRRRSTSNEIVDEGHFFYAHPVIIILRFKYIIKFKLFCVFYM